MTTDFEDKYLDVLQNIEWGLLSCTKNNATLCDHDILRVVEHAIAYYKSQERECFLAERKLADTHQEIFEKVTVMCDWRLGLRSLSPSKNLYCDPISPEELILCLKRIEKSIKFWTKQGGRRGYITFVSSHVPV
ncbi:MAG TPA: hypothetical protein VLE95_05240 [Chlamydiales bacterium]|nr:hypothetical protein [Chlamydiales bacterium]